MTTKEVAAKLVQLCSQGKFMEAIESLYAKNIVSVEPMEMPGLPRTMTGYDAVYNKSKWWMENHTVHSSKVTGPFCSPEKFAVVFEIDVTFKPNGKRSQMSEIAVYTVEAGKIVHEEFLYNG